MRYGMKRYWKIPGGEIQWGLISGRIVIWFRGKKYVVKRGPF